jgi:hypothetical protein
VLAWFPTANSVSTLSGYALAKSATDVLITKGINKYFYNEGLDLKNTNVTLVLRLTQQGTSVIINGRVLDKDNNNAVLFDRTVVDTDAADILADGTDDPAAAYTGDGRCSLICYQDNGTTQPSYEVVYDNLEVFVLDHTVLDNFNDNVKTAWQDFTFVPGFGIPVEENGQFRFTQPPAGRSIFSASTKTSRNFDLVNGERLELSVDLVQGLGADSFAVLGWFPTANSVSTLSGYGLAKSATDVLITKGINKYFYNEGLDLKNTNVTLVLRLAQQGTSVIINARVLDKDNDNAVLFDRTVVDTEAADILADGTDDPAAPYTGAGRFVLICYQDNGTTQPAYEVIYDNAEVSAPPLPANIPAVISDIQPEPFANFLPETTVLSFKVADDKALVNSGISVTLNGQVFNAGNGLSIAGSGANRDVSFSGLSNNVNYAAVLQVVDADNATNSVLLYFDTFDTENVVIETEDYNFGNGLFIDNPVLVPEGSGPQPDGYRNQAGVAGADYQDFGGGAAQPYRPSDSVGMQRSLDIVRQKFIDAGGAAAGFYDYDTGGFLTDEWLVYTRTFPAGSYEVYLRQSLVNSPQSECALERVIGGVGGFIDPVGTFLGQLSGFTYRNVPLTDASGQTKITITLAAGTHTFRLRQVSPNPPEGALAHNYLVFVPAEGSGPLRPLVTSLSPRNGAVVETIAPVIRATIRNRDTILNVDSIALELNGSPVTPTITSDIDNAEITYAVTPLPPPNALNRARLVFADDAGVFQTNDWSFTITYKFLDPLNRRPGPGSAPGFLVRVVQAPAGSGLENNLQRAEDQLAPNSPYPAVIDTNTTAQVVNFSQDAPPANSVPYFDNDISVPGLYDETGASLGNGTDDFAMEVLAYLDLPAGVYRFGARTDDGYKISSGASLRDLGAPPLAGHSGGPADETFDFVVLVSGLYPFRMVWYERGGSGHAEWFSVNLATDVKTLINDPNTPGSIKAYMMAPRPLFLQSAALVQGPYQDDATANIDTMARRITVPIQGNARFYRLRSDVSLRITAIRIEAGNVVLTYE